MLRNTFLVLALAAPLVFSGCIDGGTGNEAASDKQGSLNDGSLDVNPDDEGQDGIFDDGILPDENIPGNANMPPGQSGNVPLPELQLEPFNGDFFQLKSRLAGKFSLQAPAQPFLF